MRNRLIIFFLSMSAGMHALFDAYYAQQAYKNNDHDQAYEYYIRDAAKSNGSDGLPLYNMGVVAYQKQDYETARDCFARAAEASSPLSDVQRAQIHFNLGKVYEKLQRYDEAEEQFDKSLSYDPNNERAKEAKEQVQRERQKQQNLADKPSEESEQQDQGESDTHNKEEQNQGEGNEGAKDGNDEKECSHPDSQNDGDNATHSAEKNANGADYEGGQESQEQSGLDNRDHNGTNTLKENNLPGTQPSMNMSPEQKLAADEKLTEIDKKVLAAVGELDNKLQKELMKIALKQQPVRHGQKSW